MTEMKYKRYSVRSIKHLPVFKEVSYVLIQRLPTEAKTVQKSEDDIVQSKPCYKIIEAYLVVQSTP